LTEDHGTIELEVIGGDATTLDRITGGDREEGPDLHDHQARLHLETDGALVEYIAPSPRGRMNGCQHPLRNTTDNKQNPFFHGSKRSK